MLSKQEIKQWLLENCVDEYGDLDLSELDFSDFEGDVCINNMTVKHDLIQSNQQVDGDLYQRYQTVDGKLWQDYLEFVDATIPTEETQDKTEVIEEVPEKAQIMKKIFDNCLETYKRKNADYGDSFAKEFKEDGFYATKYSVGHKFRRFKTLMTKDPKVKGETIEDTLLDMINYIAMTLVEMEVSDGR